METTHTEPALPAMSATTAPDFSNPPRPDGPTDGFKARMHAPGLRERGMTLIEVIVVVALVGGLMVYVAGSIASGSRTARERETSIGFGQVRSSLQMYKLATGRFPSSDQGLRALIDRPDQVRGWRGPYVEPELLRDAWGNDLQYVSDGKEIQLLSAGDDGLYGTEDDLRWPAPRDS